MPKKTNAVINRGTSGGGANTNLNGSEFEEKTSIEKHLDKFNYVKKEIYNNNNKTYYYYQYLNDYINIIYFKKNSFKLYFKKEFNIKIDKQPDEAYLIKIEDTYILKILEKKFQKGKGSVDEKLKTGDATRYEYGLILNNNKYKFIIEYCFCVSKFLQDKFESNDTKFKNFKKIIEKHKVGLLYGDDDNYIEKLFYWIYKI